MIGLEVLFQLGVVEKVAISSCIVPYANEALLVLVSAVLEQGIRIVKVDPAEFAVWMTAKAGISVVRSLVAAIHVHFQAAGGE